MRKALLILALIFAMAGLAQAQQKQVLSAAATTCTTTGTSCLINTVDPSAGGVTFTVTANASGNTLQLEASGDGGATWVALNATPSNSTTAATSTTSTGTWQANIAAYTNVRIRMSTLAGGTSTVSIIFSIASARAGGGGGGGGVTSFTGDGTIITNSASTGAVTATIAGTSGGIPFFASTSSWHSSGLLAANHILYGGGAGVAPGSDNGCTTNTIGTLSCSGYFAASYGFSTGLKNIENQTAPTIAAAGCGGSAASISTANGTAAFKVNVGTSNTGTCTITMPAATTDWVCSATDITTTSTTVSQTKAKPGGTPTTQVTLQNYTDVSATGAWVDSDVIEVFCHGE